MSLSAVYVRVINPPTDDDRYSLTDTGLRQKENRLK